MKNKVSRKRMIQGRDFHGWVWRAGSPDYQNPIGDRLFFWAESDRPADKRPTESGRWVRCKFVEVK